MVKRHKRLIQFGEYMVGGAVWFWSGYAMFAVTYSVLGWNWFPAKVAADVTGHLLNFMLQRYWAFNDPKLKGQDRRVRLRYLTITGISYVIDYLIVGGLNSIGITPYIGLFAAAGFFTAWNYLWYRFWVFKPKH